MDTVSGASEPRQFYDELAADYHVNYENWNEAVARQGTVLAQVIRTVRGLDGPATVLDCSCGIGTQAIGLALQGFAVMGTDISLRSIDRARREAQRFGVEVTWGVADFRTLSRDVSGVFDIVVSCDNSLPHLLTDEDLELATGNMLAKIAPGGMVMIGIRDYDRLRAEQPRFTPLRLVEQGDERSVLFQLWDWSADGATYRLTMFRHRQTGTEWTTQTGTTTYRALTRIDLGRFLQQAGFVGITWHEPDATGHHQPLVTARKSPARGTT